MSQQVLQPTELTSQAIEIAKLNKLKNECTECMRCVGRQATLMVSQLDVASCNYNWILQLLVRVFLWETRAATTARNCFPASVCAKLSLQRTWWQPNPTVLMSFTGITVCIRSLDGIKEWSPFYERLQTMPFLRPSDIILVISNFFRRKRKF